MQDPTYDRALSQEELRLIATLTDEQLAEIDAMLLSYVHPKYNRKLAYIVAATMNDLPNRITGIPDVFYAQRVARMVEHRILIAEGNLSRMRYCEVRFA